MAAQQTTRHLILNFLQRRQTATSAEISRSLHLTRANIRHHLNVLLQEGVVQILSKRHLTGRGRPELIYGLTHQVANHNLDTLLDALLNTIILNSNPDEKAAILQDLAAKILTTKDWKPLLNSSFSVRLFNCANILNSMKYEFRWEAHARAPQIIFGHCPYAVIIAKHPELCEFDAYLLEVMLGMPVRQTAYLEPTPSGIPQCVFQAEFKPT